MNEKLLFKYIFDVNIFCIAFCAVSLLIFGFLWGIIMFPTIGLVVGLLGFKIFKNQEYYTYYNLGYTKTELAISVFVFNVMVSVFLLAFYLIIKP